MSAIGKLWSAMRWPFRDWRWLRIGAAYFLLCWLWMQFFDVAQGPVKLPFDVPAGEYTVYVADYGYHTSIIVPQLPAWGLGHSAQRDAPWVEYGWGDRGFYYESDMSPWWCVRAALTPTRTVGYVSGHRHPPEQALANLELYRKQVDAATLKRLIARLEGSMLATTMGRRRIELPDRGDYRGRFSYAHGSYIFWRSCNRWTCDVLSDAGLDVNPLFVVTAGQATGRLQGWQRIERPEPTKG